MKRTPLVVVLAALFVAPFALASSTANKSTAAPATTRCGGHDHGARHTVVQFSRRAKRAYAGRLTTTERAQLRHLKWCAQSGNARNRMKKAEQRIRAARRAARIASSLTPYCGSHGCWAIPEYIVACETGGTFSWSAYNPSGARGPYQFLGWNVPWPVRTQADKNAHHRMAARLWAGGSGASHWVCA